MLKQLKFLIIPIGILFFSSCSNDDNEVVAENPELEVSITELSVSENDLLRGNIPISIKADNSSSVIVYMDEQEVYESEESEFTFELKTTNFDDGTYTLKVEGSNSEFSDSREVEVELFNKLMTYELTQAEFDYKNTEWMLIMLANEKGKILDYIFAEEPGIFNFESDSEVPEDEFMFYTYWDRNETGSSLQFLMEGYQVSYGEYGSASSFPPGFPEPPVYETFELNTTSSNFGQNDSNEVVLLLTPQIGIYGVFFPIFPSFPVNYPEDQENYSFLFSDRVNDRFYSLDKEPSELQGIDEFNLDFNEFQLIEPTSTIDASKYDDFTASNKAIVSPNQTNHLEFHYVYGTETLKSFNVYNGVNNYQDYRISFLGTYGNYQDRFDISMDQLGETLPEMTYQITVNELDANGLTANFSGDDEGLVMVELFNTLPAEGSIGIVQYQSTIYFDMQSDISFQFPKLPESLLTLNNDLAGFQNIEYVLVNTQNKKTDFTTNDMFMSLYNKADGSNFKDFLQFNAKHTVYTDLNP